MSISQLITSNFMDFNLECTWLCRFTLLSNVCKKCQCCWRGNV